MKEIPLFKVFMSESAPPAASKVLMSGHVAQGPIVNYFEGDLQSFFDVPKVVTVNSGTSALHLALHLIGAGPGDEVITTAQTCVATNGGIVLRGATPVFVDVNARSGLIDPASVAGAITAKTKAIVAVDWAGHPCDYDALRSHGIPVIQDAAHAVGTMYNGGHVAKTGGDYVCFSFQAIKHLTTVDGGALVVPVDQLERAQRLRWFGLDRHSKSKYRFKQDIPEAGYKFHMNDVAASIGRENIKHLPKLLAQHRANAERLWNLLDGVHGIELPERDMRSSWWLFTIKVRKPYAFADGMTEKRIGCSPVHARNDTMRSFRSQSRMADSLDGLEEFAEHQVSIPVGWWLEDEDLQWIAESAEACAKVS